jgi:hypothetical protein
VPHPFVIRSTSTVFIYWLAYILAQRKIYGALGVASSSGHAWLDTLFLGIAALGHILVLVKYGYVFAESEQARNT